MIHALFILFVFVAIFGIATVFFAVWLGVSVIRWIVRLLLGPGLKPPQTVTMTSSHQTRRCNRAGCHAINASTARFCRRCGQSFQAPQHVPVQRAAVL